MRDYAEIFLQIHRRLKDLQHQKLKLQHTEAYLISCDVTELAQELEDVLQRDANIQ